MKRMRKRMAKKDAKKVVAMVGRFGPIGLGTSQRWEDPLLKKEQTEQERFIARARRETMGRRSSLLDSAHKERAQEKSRIASFGMTGWVGCALRHRLRAYLAHALLRGGL